MLNDLNYPIQKNKNNDPNRFMVSWWGTDYYFNNRFLHVPKD